VTNTPLTPNGEIQRALDREVDLVLSAVTLVARGVAPSTIVAGLQLGEAVLAVVQPMADAQGVVLEAMWGSDERGFDIRVRRGDETP
jgi:hypothetical protein